MVGGQQIWQVSTFVVYLGSISSLGTALLNLSWNGLFLLSWTPSLVHRVTLLFRFISRWFSGEVSINGILSWNSVGMTASILQNGPWIAWFIWSVRIIRTLRWVHRLYRWVFFNEKAKFASSDDECYKYCLTQGLTLHWDLSTIYNFCGCVERWLEKQRCRWGNVDVGHHCGAWKMWQNLAT